MSAASLAARLVDVLPARAPWAGEPAMSHLLARFEDFRLLPLFVLFSMTVGILIGNALSISDFTLTPPIDAIKSIAAGTFEPTVPALISLGVPIGLFAMMYPAMTNVRLGEVGDAFRSPRQLGVVLVANYLIAPFLMLALANLFVADPELRTGLILYGLAPCIAMVIIFTYLAKGVERSVNYYSAPDDAMEGPDEAEPWARLAYEAALRKRAGKGKRRKG